MALIISALKCESIFEGTFICGVGAKRLPDFKGVDYLINIGICAGEQIGELYEINAINGRYFPDCFGDFKRAQLTTVDQMASKIAPGILYDMESATIYKRACKCLGPHQMHFLKVVSDNGQEVTDKNYVQVLIKRHKTEIEDYITKLSKVAPLASRAPLAPDLDLSQFRLTATMRERHLQQLKYAHLIGVDISDFLSPNMNKKECQHALEKIDEFLLRACL
ncbi:MAG: hypothetical protein MJ189_01020 [Coriobacteriales bacterium]|nr:hypothetical protein [Coriobacteriales bacterium]